MEALRCQICGGSLAMMEDTVTFICEYCGTKYSKQVLQKIFAEITGTVRVEGPVQVEGIASISSLLQRAQEYAECHNYEKAKEYYNRVLDISPTNETARQWLDTRRLSKTEQEKIAQIADCIKKGNKLNAIKAYNYMTGKGLLESKEIIESIQDYENTQEIINVLISGMKN